MVFKELFKKILTSCVASIQEWVLVARTVFIFVGGFAEMSKQTILVRSKYFGVFSLNVGVDIIWLQCNGTRYS